MVHYAFYKIITIVFNHYSRKNLHQTERSVKINFAHLGFYTINSLEIPN